MKKIFLVTLLLFILIFFINLKASRANMSVSAQCAILMESSSGRILYKKNINEQRPIASISKIMTAIVAIENANLDDYVTISKKATLQIGSSLYLQEGDKITLRDLIYGLLLRSGNDAAYAIGEYVGDGNVDKFILMMNEKAKELGMFNSTFENPSGLDETTRNISTAYDMALVTKYAMNNPLYREINNTSIHKAKTVNEQIYVWENKHRLIKSYDYIIGGKTGFTKLARRTLVTVAKKDDLELIVVTLNDSNDWEDHMNLFNYGFKEYEMHTIMRKGIFEVKSLDKIFFVDDKIEYPISDKELNDFKIIIDVDNINKKTFLLLVSNNKVLRKKEIREYDSSNSELKNNITIVDIGRGIIKLIREILW